MKISSKFEGNYSNGFPFFNFFIFDFSFTSIVRYSAKKAFSWWNLSSFYCVTLSEFQPYTLLFFCIYYVIGLKTDVKIRDVRQKFKKKKVVMYVSCIATTNVYKCISIIAINDCEMTDCWTWFNHIICDNI